MTKNQYWGIGALFALPVFIGCWIYCVAEYGFLVGVGIGWLPSAIVSVLVASLWPLLAIAVAIVFAGIVWTALR
jgi:hypothetical protein